MTSPQYWKPICAAFLAISLPVLAEEPKVTKPELKPAFGFVDLQDGDSFVFLGDSITHRSVYNQYVENYFFTRLPSIHIHFHNAGISADTGGDALERFDDDVVPFKPKYVSVLIGMNDAGYREFDKDFFATFKNNMIGLMDRIEGLGAKAILMTPTMYDSRARRLFGEPLEPRDTYYNGVLALYGAWVREQAEVRGLGFVDMYSRLNNLTFQQRRDDPKWTMIRDSFHPDAPGMAVMAGAIINDVVKPGMVSDVLLRRAGDDWKAVTENAEVSELKDKEGALTFTLKANALPWVLPAEAAAGWEAGHLAEKFSRERLAVVGLKPGSYTLKIDGEAVGEWDEVKLAAGVDLQRNEKTPQYQQAAKIAALNKKRHEAFIHPACTEFQQIKGKRHDLHQAEYNKSPDLDQKRALLERTRVEQLAKVAELLKQAQVIEDQIYGMNLPVPHRYELVLTE